MKRTFLLISLATAGLCASAVDYTITTAAEWNALAADTLDLTGKVILIANDIDFDGDTIKPIPALNGELNGNSKTISGFVRDAACSYDAALVATVDTAGYIHDLTVEGTYTSAYSYTGSIVGNMMGTISNVTSNVSVVASATYNAGMFGYATGATFTGCVNRGSVTSSAGYFAGFVANCANCSFTDCGNEGDVTCSGKVSAAYAAGFASYVAAGNSSFIRCYNTGAVTSGSNTSSISDHFDGLISYLNAGEHTLTGCYNTGYISGVRYTAGLVGYLGTGVYITATDCYNTGDVVTTATSTSYTTPSAGLFEYSPAGSTFTRCWNSGNVTGNRYVGGLFGNYGATPSESYPLIVRDCYNTGNITSSYRYCGGIFGQLPSYTTVVNCHNTGDITATAYYVGGIVGYLTGTGSAIDSCYNTGKIEGPYYVGGIVGYDYRPSKISNCYNAGSVTGSYGSLGGIVGLAYLYGGDTIINCFNTADITSTATASGTSISANGYAIGGIVGYGGNSYMKNVYNTGSVTGTNAVGGIVGYPYASSKSGKCTVDCAYSTGKVTAIESTVGNVIGTANTNSFTNLYYLATNANGYDPDTLATALTYAELATLDLGDAWTAGDDYTYPRVATLADNDYAKAHAAAVIPLDSQTYDSISGSFYIGLPDGVTWTSSSDALTIDGNTVTLTGDIDGEVTMTATCGDVAVATIINCYNYVEADTIVSYYLTGDFNSWNTADTTYLFTESDSAGVYTLVAESANFTTSTGFKIVSSTNVWLGYADGYNIDYDIFYTFSTDGNNTYLNSAPTADNLYFTLTADDSGYTLRVSQDASGISAARSASRQIVDESFYTTSGVRVAEPADGQKAIYIVRRVYSDGTVETLKEVR